MKLPVSARSFFQVFVLYMYVWEVPTHSKLYCPQLHV